LHVELYKLYPSPNIILFIKLRRMRWTGHEARMVLVGSPGRRRPLRRPRCRYQDNIKMDLREVGWGGMDWINLA
jgi:hypothetical protein